MKKIITLIISYFILLSVYAQNQAYRGGVGDGYTYDSVQSFNPMAYILKFSPYRGGNGDVYAAASLTNVNPYNYINKFAPFAGGNNDGWTGQPVINIVSITNYTGCNDTTLTVSFQTNGIINAGNIYTVQLSDITGSFATPDTVGVLSSIALTGSINLVLPGNLSAGTYFLRIISSNQPIIGFSKALVYSVKPNLGADTTLFAVCNNETFNLTTLFNTSGLTMNWGTPNPIAADTGIYTVIGTNSTGCKDTALVTIKQDVAIWTGTISNDWHTAGNWNTNKIPGVKTHVIINGTTPFTCTINTPSAMAASIQVKNNASLTVVNNNNVTITAQCAPLPN